MEPSSVQAGPEFRSAPSAIGSTTPDDSVTRLSHVSVVTKAIVLPSGDSASDDAASVPAMAFTSAVSMART
jgi:hypothetical protein